MFSLPIRLWQWSSCCLALAIALGSLLPLNSAVDIAGSDKLYHFIAYSLLAYLLARSYLARIGWLKLASGVVVYGAVIEILQGFSGYRSAELGDLLANILGCSGGLLLHQLTKRWF